MKKVLVSIFIAIFVLVSLPCEVRGQEKYLIEITTSTEDLISTRATSTKTVSRTLSVKNSAGQQLWYVKVTGTFAYDGRTSSCKSSTVTANATNQSWRILNKSSSKSGNTAKANATAGLYRNGINIESLFKTISISCDAKGIIK